MAIDVPFDHLLMVGQVTLQGFKWIERFIFSLFIVLFIFLGRSDRFEKHLCLLVGGVIFVFILQQFLILPILDSRMEMRLSGHYVPSSYWHDIYVFVEVSKAIIVASIGIFLNIIGEETWSRKQLYLKR